MMQDHLKIGTKRLIGQLPMLVAGLTFTLSTPSTLAQTSIEQGFTSTKPGAATTNSTALPIDRFRLDRFAPAPAG